MSHHFIASLWQPMIVVCTGIIYIAITGQHLNGNFAMSVLVSEGNTRVQALHGALLGTAELLLALQATASRPEPAVLQRAVAEPKRLQAARLFRGKGGELLRAGVCRCESPYRLPLPCN